MTCCLCCFCHSTNTTRLTYSVVFWVSSLNHLNRSVCSVLLTSLASLHQPLLGPDSVANSVYAEALGASVSVAATVSHLLGLPASSSVIMTIYRPSPLVPDVFVLHFCYDEAQMSYITRMWLLSTPLWFKEKGGKKTTLGCLM